MTAYSPARIKRALWRRGDLDYLLHAGQAKIDTLFRSSEGKLFVGNCSRRFGKTYWAAGKCIETAIKTDDARVKYVSAFLTDLEEFAIPAFQKALQDVPDFLRPRWFASKKKWIFPNGSEIKLIGLDRNPNGLRGNYADLVVFEEAGLISRLMYLYSDVCLPMTLYRPGARVIMISTPPETPDHPFKDFCERAEAADAFMKLTIYENPMLSAAEIEEIKTECLSLIGGETTWKREYLCEFVVDQERAIIPEWLDEYEQEVERPADLFQYLHKYEAMDLGVVDQTAAIFAWYDFPKARVVIEDEVIMNGPSMTTDVLAEALIAKEAQLWPSDKAYLKISDNDNLLLLADLASKYDLHFSPTGKDTLEAMVNQVRIWVKEGRVVVHPRCKFLLGCLRNGIWDKQRKKFARSTTYGHYDALAALVYLIRNIRASVNPIPPQLGMDPANYHIRPEAQLSPSAKELKKLIRRR